MADQRMTYKGSSLRVASDGAGASGNLLYRVQSFGSSTQLSREEQFELGNPAVAKVIQDLSQAEGTIEAVENGSLKNLCYFFNKTYAVPNPLGTGTTAKGTTIDFSQDADNAITDVWAYLKHSDGTVWTQAHGNCYLNGVNYTLGTDGNFTERYSIVADNKVWGADGVKALYAEGVAIAGDATANRIDIVFTGATIQAIVSVRWYRQSDSKWIAVAPSQISKFSATTVRVTFPTGALATGDKVVAFVLQEGVSVSDFAKDTETVNSAVLNATRKGYARVYLLRPTSGNKLFNTTTRKVENVAEELYLGGIQSLSIDASLDREELPELGNSRPYARPVVQPIGVNVSLELTQRDLELFKRMKGLDKTNTDLIKAISPDDWSNDLGLRIKLYNKADSSADTDLVKMIDVPYLTPDTENWNLGVSGSATQGFGFKSHDLIIKNSITY